MDSAMKDLHTEMPIFSFGVIADIQYADANDGYNYSRTRKRYYRGALSRLQEAVTSWMSDTIQPPAFVLQLGDIIDGLNKRLHTGISEISLQRVVEVLGKLNIPLYHVWGNHEYYNFSREQLLNSSIYSGNLRNCSPGPGKVYYSVQPHSQLRVLAVDCYEISLLASPEGSDEWHHASEILSEINRNEDKNSCHGLKGADLRFVKFNGAVSQQQLTWLKDNLEEAQNMQQNVIVIGHCSVYAPATDENCLCWNAPQILSLMHQYSTCVTCYLSGHDHGGGDAIDACGIHHVTFPGVLENNMDSDYGTMYVYQKILSLKGNGRVKTMHIPLRYDVLS